MASEVEDTVQLVEVPEPVVPVVLVPAGRLVRVGAAVGREVGSMPAVEQGAGGCE